MRGSWREGLTRRPRGLTVIELVVVMTIVGMVALLLLPTILRAVMSSRAEQCKGNLRQISSAFMMYVKHYDGFMAPSGSPTAEPPHRFPRWYDNLGTFARDPGIYRCPSKKRARIGYGLNDTWSGVGSAYGAGQPMSDRSTEIDQVLNPAGTLVFCDTGYVTNIDDAPFEWVESSASNEGGCVRFPYDNEPVRTGRYTPWVTSPWRAVPRHLGAKTNVLFFDGHIRGIGTLDIVDDLWDDPGCLYDNDGHPKRS
ncbi:type II secretion system protein [Planctomycetota bacterium]